MELMLGLHKTKSLVHAWMNLSSKHEKIILQNEFLHSMIIVKKYNEVFC